MANKKKCEYEFCSKSFSPKVWWQKFCSKMCNQKDHWQRQINKDIRTTK